MADGAMQERAAEDGAEVERPGEEALAIGCNLLMIHH
jgi:hypothetical protein